MMGISLIGLVVVAVALIFGLAKGVSAMLGLFKSAQGGHATLACPHCDQQTSHANGQCDACGREL
ncbi:MAG: hypothetical protein DWI21_03960 [Planctomycetota bacterium]|nr:MAG: hypothetical protein DWI21_03960 [Planctomycetota bacterium]GDY07880.1 hypothetical protein LBMAG52_13660 [Planctomycetia bacterium]